MKSGVFTKTEYIASTPISQNSGLFSACKNLFAPEVMLCFWWNFQGVIHFVRCKGHAVDADL